MSNFFQNSDIDVNKAEKIVSDTLNKCDDGELYLEDSKSESILLDDNKIKSSNYTTDLGYGFRAITGDVVAYSHSNEISNKSLKNILIIFIELAYGGDLRYGRLWSNFFKDFKKLIVIFNNTLG